MMNDRERYLYSMLSTIENAIASGESIETIDNLVYQSLEAFPEKGR